MWLYKMWYEDNMYLDMCPYVLIHEKWKIVSLSLWYLEEKKILLEEEKCLALSDMCILFDNL